MTDLEPVVLLDSDYDKLYWALFYAPSLDIGATTSEAPDEGRVSFARQPSYDKIWYVVDLEIGLATRGERARVSFKQSHESSKKSFSSSGLHINN